MKKQLVGGKELFSIGIGLKKSMEYRYKVLYTLYMCYWYTRSIAEARDEVAYT